MDHHRARAGPEARNLAIELLARRILIEKLAEEDLRMDVGNNGALRFIAASIGKNDARRLSACRDDLVDARAQHQFAALALQHGRHRLDDRIGSPLADHHAEGLIGHGFEIRKQRAAGDIGRKIEMQPPGGHHRFELGILEAGVEKIARRGKQHARRVVDPADPLFAPRLPDDLGGGHGGHGRAEQTEDMRGIRAKLREHIAPGGSILRRYIGDGTRSLLQIGTDAEVGIVAEDAGEAIRSGPEAQAFGQQLILVLRKEGGACEHGKVHGAKIVPEAGQRHLAGLDCTARLSIALDDGNLPAFRRQMHRRRQAIVPRSHYDRIIAHRSPLIRR
ncbi:hypothetical protein RHSP_24663 [Rhizobium freirei PRF 81]|uniref:Uncharacterized protein n=1 Tax=Rhizobium freirei PRF 81 TaxID=363754 RepID=N6UAJ5_9HYPH|nr:hypothetical protein RHSP_24663 [Rhizobium freirei PRF 81]